MTTPHTGAHPLTLAHSPTPAANGQTIWCICGWDGCRQRLQVDALVWAAEQARRAARAPGVQVWHARGDRLVPVAPDVDGLVPPYRSPGQAPYRRTGQAGEDEA